MNRTSQINGFLGWHNLSHNSRIFLALIRQCSGQIQWLLRCSYLYTLQLFGWCLGTEVSTGLNFESLITPKLQARRWHGLQWQLWHMLSQVNPKWLTNFKQVLPAMPVPPIPSFDAGEITHEKKICGFAPAPGLRNHGRATRKNSLFDEAPPLSWDPTWWIWWDPHGIVGTPCGNPINHVLVS